LRELRRRKSVDDVVVRPQPSNDSKRRRDEIRARWRRVIIEDFGTISKFRKAWPLGTQGQRTAETVYRFLQDQARTKSNEKSEDIHLSSVLAFAEMTRRSVGYLLSGMGPEWPGEVRPRTELTRDLAAVLTGAIPESLREIGLEVDGTTAMALLLIKVEERAKALQPFVELGEYFNDKILLPSQEKKFADVIEAASREVTVDIPGLLVMSGMPLLRASQGLRGKPHKNPALRSTVSVSIELARLNSEADERREKGALGEPK